MTMMRKHIWLIIRVRNRSRYTPKLVLLIITQIMLQIPRYLLMIVFGYKHDFQNRIYWRNALFARVLSSKNTICVQVGSYIFKLQLFDIFTNKNVVPQYYYYYYHSTRYNEVTVPVDILQSSSTHENACFQFEMSTKSAPRRRVWGLCYACFHVILCCHLNYNKTLQYLQNSKRRSRRTKRIKVFIKYL